MRRGLRALTCRVFSDPKVLDGSPIFVCGPPEIRKVCQFCKCHKGLSLCDWPMMKPIPFEPYYAIGEEDILVQASGWRARILGITRMSTWVNVRASVLTSTVGRARNPMKPYVCVFTISAATLRLFRVERPGTCDKACCFRHRRHVGPDRDYCMDHWRDWERVS